MFHLGIESCDSALYNGQMRACVGYIRVSTQRQANDGESLSAQRAKLMAWAAQNGYELVAVHADEGISGGSISNRPGVQAAIAEACRRRCALVAVSLSRLVRSVTDAIAIGERLSARGADLISLSENIDTTTASGRLVFKLLALLGEFERELVSERTTAVLAHLKEQGRRVGRIPYGFDLHEDGVMLVPNKAEQAMAQQMRAWHREGASFREIARRLEHERIPTKEGRPIWLPKTVAAVVRRAPTGTGESAA
jgi:DNA invertase Pin-like site-specific DNA recombinase